MDEYVDIYTFIDNYRVSTPIKDFAHRIGGAHGVRVSVYRLAVQSVPPV